MTFQNFSSPWRRRIRVVMLCVLLTLGLGIAAVERWRQDEFDMVWSPANKIMTYFLNPIGEKTHNAVMVALRLDRLWVIEEENKHLSLYVTQLQVKNQMLAEELSRLNRLAGLGHWVGPDELRFVSCDVVGLIGHEATAALIINRGRVEGVRPRDPVVALGGLVGIVQSVASHTARVQAITDPLSAVGALDKTSRARGILYGLGRTKPLAFMPENEVQPIEKNAVLITSGFENSVFPKGIVIGVIQGRKLNPYGIPYGEVKPAVSFEALEEVLLVLPKNRPRGADQPTSPSLGVYTISMPRALMRNEDSSGTQTLHTARTADRPSTATLVTTGTLFGPPVPAGLDRSTSASLARSVSTGTPTPTPTPKPKKSKPKPRPTPDPEGDDPNSNGDDPNAGPSSSAVSPNGPPDRPEE